jgi:integrase/recombinase XerD
MSTNRKIPVVLDLEEIETIKKAPGTRFRSGKRDKAIIWLTLNTGLRVDEVINLKPKNIDLKNKVIALDHAKKDSFGNVVFNSNETIELIKAWLKVRPKSEWLFCTITQEKKNIADKGGITIPGNKLTRQYLTSMVKRYARKAGITKNVSFHTLRHTYATWLYINKHDIETVRQQLRHKSINTTTIYTQTAWQFEGHKALNGFQL